MLAAEPDLLVLDEPTRGLDPERKEQLASLVRASPPCVQRSSSATIASSPASADRVVELGVGRPRMSRGVLSGSALAGRDGAGLDGPATGRRRALPLLATGGLVVAIAAWLETGPGTSRELALVATRAAAAVTRQVCSRGPGSRPITVIAVAAGAALGPRAG